LPELVSLRHWQPPDYETSCIVTSIAAEPAPVASGSLFKIAQSDGKRTEIHALIKLTPTQIRPVRKFKSSKELNPASTKKEDDKAANWGGLLFLVVVLGLDPTQLLEVERHGRTHTVMVTEDGRRWERWIPAAAWDQFRVGDRINLSKLYGPVFQILGCGRYFDCGEAGWAIWYRRRRSTSASFLNQATI
jgi:hypothetical protein